MKQVGIFKQIFTGNTDIYGQNDLNNITYEEGSDKGKTKIRTIQKPLTESSYANHLTGKYGLAVCPINSDSKCLYGVIDIDLYDSKSKYTKTKLVNFIYEYNLPLIPFDTKSGGLHLYLFLRQETSAKSLVNVLNKFVRVLGLDKLFTDNANVSKVEVFPKQTVLVEGQRGSTITLPYFNGLNKPLTTALAPNYKPIPLDNFLNRLKDKITTVKEFDDLIDNLDWNDAPPCIQKILLLKLLGEDSGRDNFLLSAGVYLKKKLGGDFKTALQEVNQTLSNPLETADVERIFKSVSENEYNYKCKDIPCQQFCDSRSCSKRTYGVGKEKGHFTGIDYGTLTRYMTAEPYYVWELKLMGQDEYKKIVFKDATKLLDQKNFAKECIDHLSEAPVQLADNNWRGIINAALKNVKDVKIKEDTSDFSAFKYGLFKYLTQRSNATNKPINVLNNLSYRTDTDFYFQHRGFEDYLLSQKVNMKNITLREVLISLECVESSLPYTNREGKQRFISCWKRPICEEIRQELDFIEDLYSEQQDKRADIIEGVETNATNDFDF